MGVYQNTRWRLNDCMLAQVEAKLCEAITGRLFSNILLPQVPTSDILATKFLFQIGQSPGKVIKTLARIGVNTSSNSGSPLSNSSSTLIVRALN
nr:hypothetical protein [uncultured Bacteroides sp.]